MVIYALPTIGRKNQYDGLDEFWVTVKEKGKKVESMTYEELHTKEAEAIWE